MNSQALLNQGVTVKFQVLPASLIAISGLTLVLPCLTAAIRGCNNETLSKHKFEYNSLILMT